MLYKRKRALACYTQLRVAFWFVFAICVLRLRMKLAIVLLCLNQQYTVKYLFFFVYMFTEGSKKQRVCFERLVLDIFGILITQASQDTFGGL